ncbi:glutathione peroxidase [Paenibacillus cisolokensis]|uniref:glutathione peroxidase n=1 Tax=Paenibacillus cisolokensis TaxID=1658519 RepID=UPI003D29CC06
MSIYDFPVETITGEKTTLAPYRGKVLIIVNTASQCGFTPQYAGLQQLHEEYKERGVEILGFPCNQFGGQEPGTNADVQQFCQTNYGVTFPMFAKTDVRGENAHPLFIFLTRQAPFKGFNLDNPRAKKMNDFLKEQMPDLYEGDGIKWNFTKFLIDREGNVIGRFESPDDPQDMKPAIEQLL